MKVSSWRVWLTPTSRALLDAGSTEDGRAYLVLEYIDGVRVDEYCEALSIPERVRLFVNVVAAVAHAHAHLIIHRDIKPSNVLVTTDHQVKLLDFGIAKLLSSDVEGSAPELTRVEDRALTPDFAAPEQLLGGLPSTATDVYQLGLLLYVILTGQHPLAHTRTPEERIRAALDDATPRASQLASRPLQRAIEGDLDAILQMALRHDPAQRYPTAQALQEDLQRYLNHEPVEARRGAAWYRVRKFVERHRFAVAASTVGVLGLITAVTVALVQGNEAAKQRDAARTQLARAAAANDFTTFLLSVAAPGGSKLSASDLLEQSERLIDKQFEGDEALKAEMLATVGVQYMLSERWTEARSTLRRSLELATRTGDPGLRARASCPLALVEILNGKDKEAALMMESALKGLTDDPEYDQLRAECLIRKSEFGYFNGNGEQMIEHASAAMHLLSRIEGVSAQRRSDAQASLAYGYYLAHRNADADREFAAVVRVMESAGLSRTLAAADVMNNWSLVHYRSDIRKAEPLLKQAMELRRSIEGPDGVAPTVSFNYAGTLLMLGRLDEAAPLFEETIRTAAARQETRIMFDAMMELAELRIESGDLDAAQEQLDKLTPHLKHPRFDIMRTAQLTYYRGHLAEIRGDPRSAHASYTEAKRGFDSLEQKIAMNVSVLCGLARTELALGNPTAATSAANEAWRLAETLAEPNSPSRLLGTALLAVGTTQRARGEVDASALSFKRARENLEHTLGPSHALTRQAQAAML